MFKGSIPIQAAIIVRLEVDANAKGPAVLAVAWSGGGVPATTMSVPPPRVGLAPRR